MGLCTYFGKPVCPKRCGDGDTREECHNEGFYGDARFANCYKVAEQYKKAGTTPKPTRATRAIPPGLKHYF